MDSRYQGLSREEREAFEQGDRTSKHFAPATRKLLWSAFAAAAKSTMPPEERARFDQQGKELAQQKRMIRQIYGDDATPDFMERIETGINRLAEDLILQIDNSTGGHGQKLTGFVLDTKDGAMAWISSQAEAFSRQFSKK